MMHTIQKMSYLLFTSLDPDLHYRRHTRSGLCLGILDADYAFAYYIDTDYTLTY